MPSPPVGGRSIVCFAVVRPDGRPSVVRLLTSISRTRYLCTFLSGGISMKLAANIRHVSGNCWRGFQGQRSKIKVICVWVAEAYISTMWRREYTRPC